MISLRDVVTGFDNRDPLAEVWRRSLRGGGGGSTVITGVPPLRYIGDGRPLTDYLISGNTVQDGTPSADAPVDAQGSGVRTGNLWDEDYANISSSAIYRPIFVGDGIFTLSTNFQCFNNATDIFLLSGNVSSGINSSTNGAYDGKSITATSIGGYVTIAYRKYARQSSGAITKCKTMLNLGSTALPYEPYGFKLPLTVNGTEYPIYLGQVESTRRIKKLVLTGEEDWRLWRSSKTDVERYYYKWGKTTPSDYGLICTHFRFNGGDGDFEHIRLGGNNLDGFIIFISKTIAPTVADFKSYIADQYAAGTPVTIWYVLAEPKTAVVNEPLMKIGDYADTISFAQAGVTIPTVNGANVLDVPTKIKPSEITIKGGISSV